MSQLSTSCDWKETFAGRIFEPYDKDKRRTLLKSEIMERLNDLDRQLPIPYRLWDEGLPEILILFGPSSIKVMLRRGKKVWADRDKVNLASEWSLRQDVECRWKWGRDSRSKVWEMKVISDYGGRPAPAQLGIVIPDHESSNASHTSLASFQEARDKDLREIGKLKESLRRARDYATDVNNDNEEFEKANFALSGANSSLQARVTELEEDVVTHVTKLQQDNLNLKAQVEQLAGLLGSYVQSDKSVLSPHRPATAQGSNATSGQSQDGIESVATFRE